MSTPAPRYRGGDLIRVTAPGAVYGLVVAGGRIVEAAPIARWAVGEPERAVADYLRHRGCTFERLGSVPA